MSEDRKEQLKRLMQHVEENNRAIAEGKPLPHPLLWEEKHRLARKFHREFWSDEVDSSPSRENTEVHDD